MLFNGPISYTNKWYPDYFVEIFNVYWIRLIFFSLVLVGVEFLLCLDVTLSKNAVACFLESS